MPEQVERGTAIDRGLCRKFCCTGRNVEVVERHAFLHKVADYRRRMVARVQSEGYVFAFLGAEGQQPGTILVLRAVVGRYRRVSLHEAEALQVFRHQAPALQEAAGAVLVSFFHIELMSFRVLGLRPFSCKFLLRLYYMTNEQVTYKLKNS